MNDVVMVASTTVEIPTFLIVVIAVYLFGVWITAFALGFDRYPDEPFIVVFASAFWPAFLISIIVVSCCDKLEEIVSRDNKDRMKRLVCSVIGLIRIALLPFRPFAFGRAVSNWIKSNKGEMS